MITTPEPAPPAARAAQGARWRGWLAPVGLGILALTLAGCGLLRGRSSPQKVQVGSLVLTNTPEGNIKLLEVLQAQAARFADEYAATVAQAADDYVATSPSLESRIEAVRWKLGQATAAWIDASGANPVLNILDLTVLVTASRMVLEDERSRFPGKEGLTLLETQRRLETNVWTAVSGLISPTQQEQLRHLIEEWRRKNPGQRYAVITRLRELAAAVGRTPSPGKSAPNSVLSLLFLDPLAGLNPTAAAIEETRRLAQRAMYYGQRMPTLLNWQMQLLTLQLAVQPESKQVLDDANRLTRATETFAKVAEQLPQLVNDQREAGIRQVLDGLAAERTNLLAGLAAEEQKAAALLGEARQTLEAGSGMAVSVQSAIKSLEEFVRLVSPDTNRAPAATNSRPFNVLDYGQAAGQVGDMARELQQLLVGLNKATPKLARLGEETTADAERVLYRAFWLGLALSLVVLAGAVVAGLAYRALANKLWPQNRVLPAGMPPDGLRPK